MIKYYVYNTITGKYELTELQESVYQTLKRWYWRQDKREDVIENHEIVMSELYGDYETFHELTDTVDVVEDAIKWILIKKLHIYIEQLTEDEKELIKALFFAA